MTSGPFNYDNSGAEIVSSAKPQIKSVHFSMLPEARKVLVNEEVEFNMKHVGDVINYVDLRVATIYR